ncbi:GNAT family N-acetyltransferase [Streptomyces somaliensis]|uniref:GNAT family N-acetyltransferase n=1 Tax=Streptomyces somaliensis TaxID=78355 RepID=UPI002815AF76|nr:GNAT family N-acetyltransferase [Streptomyces somaliensis]
MTVDGVSVRAGRPEEAAELSALALRSKAHWGYDDAYLAACADELRLTPADTARRRVRVAEAGGRIVGVAVLDGEPPRADLGMLFVDPPSIGHGVGRLLYRHVLAEAGRIGCERVTVAADPHAEPFYLAMGARRVDPVPSPGRLVRMEAWPAGGDPSWVRAWTGGGRSVHLGNVAEYHAQFPGAAPAGGAPHYACLAAFAGPHPALVVLPLAVEAAWMRGLARQLDWGEVEVHCVDAPGGALSRAVLDRPALARRIRDAGLPVLPWGRTEASELLAPGPPLRLGHESKAASHRLFARLAPAHPGIRLPAQEPVRSRRELARALAHRASAGLTSVVKGEYGVGGSTTFVLTPEDVLSGGGARAAARRAPGVEWLVEEYVPGADLYRNPTFDGVVAEDGGVHAVGTGLMEVAGTAYQGVTVGPGVLPGALAATATAFGTAVGEALSAEGYRGWYDVDFVTDTAGRPAPTEINLRLTGPAAAFVLRARLDRVRGGSHLVRTLDCLPLGARLPGRALLEHLDDLARRCAALGAVLLTTIPTAGADPAPYVGVALAARSRQALDEAEALVRFANGALGGMFTSPAFAARGARRGTPRPRTRRS